MPGRGVGQSAVGPRTDSFREGPHHTREGAKGESEGRHCGKCEDYSMACIIVSR